MQENIPVYCQLYCSGCNDQVLFDCKDCSVFVDSAFQDQCEIAKCMDTKKIQLCGKCADFPCIIILTHSIRENNNICLRNKNCQSAQNILAHKLKEKTNPIGYCGHHCNHCFIGDWCGGCRSTYNCCSYATLAPDKICPNTKCALEKELDGCYQCDEIIACNKGYYSRESEYTAKATALFIRNYGQEQYEKSLEKAIRAGEKYAQSFDECGSVEKALDLLKRYL